MLIAIAVEIVFYVNGIHYRCFGGGEDEIAHGVAVPWYTWYRDRVVVAADTFSRWEDFDTSGYKV